MARNRIIGRETQKMQEYTQEQINQAESRGIEISTDVKEQLFEYANLIGEKEKVRALVRNLADAVSQADSEGVEDLLDDARMDIQELPDPTIGKLELRDYGYISTFEFKLSENLETHIFENADVDWLHCIAAHRKKKMFIEVEREMARYDIIAGKIADDATNATLTAYLAGAFGTAGDKEADDFCIRQLLPNKLKDQYCFKTEAAIECLKFVKGEKIWLK